MNQYVATYSRVPGGKLFTQTIEAPDFQSAVSIIVEISSDLGPEIVAVIQLPRPASKSGASRNG